MGYYTMNASNDTNFAQIIKIAVQANELKKAEDYLQAIDIYKGMINMFGEFAEFGQAIASCYFGLGLEKADEGYFSLAIDWLEKAIQLTPDKSRLLADLGAIYSFGTLDYQKAAEAFRASLELNPGDLEALTNAAALANVPDGVVSLEEVTIWLEKATQIEPNNPNFHLDLAMLYAKSGKKDKAKEELLRALTSSQSLETSPSRAIKKIIGIK